MIRVKLRKVTFSSLQLIFAHETILIGNVYGEPRDISRTKESKKKKDSRKKYLWVCSHKVILETPKIEKKKKDERKNQRIEKIQ